MHMIPVIRGIRPTILHIRPARPRLVRLTRLPDLLSPNDILDILRLGVLRHPLGNLPPAHGRLAALIRAHEIDGLSAAVVRVAGACARPLAANLPDATGELGDDLFCAVHGHLEARADGRDGRRAVAAEAGGGRGAALHLAGTGALVGDGRTGAVGLPAAVAVGAVGALGLEAAADARGVGGAGARDGGAAGVGAGRGGDADAWGRWVRGQCLGGA